MRTVLDDGLIYEILSVVEEIPEGRVATYGQIARLIGRERNARLVGKVLSNASWYGKYPCHRVVNHAGRLVPGWREQAGLLEGEGVSSGINGIANRNGTWCIRHIMISPSALCKKKTRSSLKKRGMKFFGDHNSL